MTSGDLSGILVVSAEQAVAAPLVSSRLAEAGARVIKVERPEGDFARGYDRLVHGESAYFVWLNRGKESICLDLREASARQVLANMIAEADVFIQNLAPGAIERLGFSPKALRKADPRLITVSISGYGEDGPYRNMKAYDLLVQGESGLSSITGTPEGSARVGISICDIAAGMTAHQSVLQALFARERTGQGRHVSVSMFHVLTDWMNVPYLQFAYGEKIPARNGMSHPTIAPYGAYADSTGREILISVQSEREWAAFCETVLCQPELPRDRRFGDNSARVANREVLDGIIAEMFSEMTREEIVERLESARTAYGKISQMEDLAVHPQNRHVEVETPTGPVRMLAPGAVVDGAIPDMGPVPALGAQTDALLAEFGKANPVNPEASPLSSAGPVRTEKTDSFTVLDALFRDADARRVLALGGGCSKLAERLAAAGYEVTLVDDRNVAERRKTLDAPLVQGLRVFDAPAYDPPVDCGPFDAACLVHALHHIPQAHMAQALRAGLSLLQPGAELLVIEPMSVGSYFRAMRPLEDESEHRAQAVAALEGLVAAGEAELRGRRRWDRVSAYDGIDGFFDSLLAVDPGRAELIEQRRQELARAWRDNVVVRGGKAELVQPIMCWRLAPPK